LGLGFLLLRGAGPLGRRLVAGVALLQLAGLLLRRGDRLLLARLALVAGRRVLALQLGQLGLGVRSGLLVGLGRLLAAGLLIELLQLLLGGGDGLGVGRSALAAVGSRARLALELGHVGLGGQVLVLRLLGLGLGFLLLRGAGPLGRRLVARVALLQLAGLLLRRGDRLLLARLALVAGRRVLALQLGQLGLGVRRGLLVGLGRLLAASLLIELL